ncbi:TetR/AcrR family transcriptional regulator [Nitrosopumilus sp.]|uniref:TetR/AcrR family transcriptional regulator n=1 Tax=Nitrosopumilus sp. TaxID=2024843 RepID=UPI002930D283|nr:TetR/AcrR family transcriptional regulator [Nitrosopumilus sp.]
MKKRELIIKTAITLFTENGFDNTSTANITKKAKVATGTLFHYFKNKRELISEAYLDTKREFFAEIKKNLSEEEEVKNTIKKIFTNSILWGIDNPEKIKFLLQFSSSPYISSVTRKKMEEDEKYFINFLKKGIKEKWIKNLPIDYILATSFNQIVSTVNYLILIKSKDRKLIEKIVLSLMDFIKN